MSYNERSFCSDFNQWIKEQYKNGVMEGSACFEIKIKKRGQRLNIKSDFKSHQIPALEKANKSFIYHKISDFSPGFHPFDSLILNKAKSFAVIMWYKPRKPKHFYMIPIKALLVFIATGALSLTEDDANRIGKIYQL